MFPSNWLRLAIVFVLLAPGLIGQPAWISHAGKPDPQHGESAYALANVLKPDGRLNLQAGFEGSLDARGWRMTTTPDGQPRFVSALARPNVAGDEWWDGEFQIGVSEPGFAAHVDAIAVQGNDVYIGGTFSRAGGIDANGIVRYNTATQHWYPLGSGTSSPVNAILVSGNSVYVGGNLNDLGGQSVGGIGRWDTVSHTWTGLGPALTSQGSFAGIVDALALDGSGNLIVGGFFDHAGTQPVSNIARWNGTNWSPLGSGIGTANGTDQVFALAISGNDIYAGGYFALPTSNLAHWNGSTWLSDSGGTNNMVRALLFNGSTLYVGGDFTQVGALTGANRIATWNGSGWSTLGGGVDNTVRSITLGSDGLYIGGLFTQADGNPANYVAKWTGAAWSASSTAFDGEVDALTASGGDVYTGGEFLVNESGQANHLAKWSVPNSTWYPLGNSPNGEIFAVAISGSDVYVGGTFNSVGGIAANNVAKWNSGIGTWSALGYGTGGCTGVPGCAGAVYAIAVNGSDVYVGGTFTSAGGLSSGPVARWNTQAQAWTAGAVADCYIANCTLAVYTLAAQGSGVVAGGNFLHALCKTGVCVVNNVVYWDGLGFSPLTDGVTNGTNDEVRALFNDGSGMYVGGAFTSPGAGSRLAYFDGNDWFAVGSGMNSVINALSEDNQYLYAGGSFSNAGGSGANRIARLPLTVGGNWQPMGAGFSGTVIGLAWNGDDLIAVGRFSNTGLLGVNNIARWNTTTDTWSPLGSGTGGALFNTIQGVAATNREIYVGGSFTTAGGRESDFLARWAHYQTFLPAVTR